MIYKPASFFAPQPENSGLFYQSRSGYAGRTARANKRESKRAEVASSVPRALAVELTCSRAGGLPQCCLALRPTTTHLNPQ